MGILEGVQDALVAASSEPWVLLALYLLCTIDGFFPPLPSESAVIVLASMSAVGEAVPLWSIVIAAAAGAMTGDVIAFSIGRRIPVHTMRLFRSRRGQATLHWAERQLERRGGVFILSARYVPVGRVAVNLTAGATGFPLRRFLVYAFLAAISWSIYSVLIGRVAGHFLGHQPLLSMAAGITGGVLLGMVVDRVLARVQGGPVRLELTPADLRAARRQPELRAADTSEAAAADTAAEAEEPQ